MMRGPARASALALVLALTGSVLTLATAQQGGPRETPVPAAPSPATPESPVVISSPSAVGYTVVFGTVQAYIEVFGEGAAALKTTFELAQGESGEALLTQAVQARTGSGGTHAVFSQVLPVRQLPPGKYYLRARVSGDRGMVQTYARAFEVAAPAVAWSSRPAAANTAAR